MSSLPPAQPSASIERPLPFARYLGGNMVQRDRFRAGLPWLIASGLHFILVLLLVMPAARPPNSLSKAPTPAVPISLATDLVQPARPPKAEPAYTLSDAQPAPQPAQPRRFTPTPKVLKATDLSPQEASDTTATADLLASKVVPGPPADAPVSDTDWNAGTGGSAEAAVGDPAAVALTSPARIEPPPTLRPVLSPEDARKLREAYLAVIFRSRIASRLFYPRSAEEDGIEGTVVVEVVIDAQGRLLSARVVSPTPAVLNTAALETVRSAQPFPPPPELLGARVDVRVSLNYQLKG